MGFVLNTGEKRFWWPVKAKEPSGGKHVSREFMGQFRQVTQREIAECFDESGEDETPGNIRLADLVLADIQGINVEAADGEDIPLVLTNENKAMLLDVTWICKAVVNAYLDSQGGNPNKAKRGN